MTRLTPAVTDGDHVRGSRDASITLVEYGDFECPYCGMAYPIVGRIKEELGERLCVVYRHFPLKESHPHADTAAEAAESAGAQGRFWEMHDQLFEHQDALADADLLRYAERIGIDATTVGTELETHVHAPTVRAHFRSGVRSGVNGTPTFFINGVRYDGSWSDEGAFLDALQGG